MHHRFLAMAAWSSLFLSACGSAPPRNPDPPPARIVPPHGALKAEAALASASGSLVSGRVVLTPAIQGLRLTGTIGGLPPNGTFGFHVHEHGDCSAVDASSAGGHFNPGGLVHGRVGDGPHHLGDMDNLQSDAAGVVQLDRIVRGVTLGDGAATDILGRALVVHADPDDYRSQPSGNAGARLACGVIRVIQ